MIAYLLVLIFFISGAVNIYALRKSRSLYNKVKAEQPEFFQVNSRYQFMSKIDGSQFILYILSGEYKKLNNKHLISACKMVRYLYGISASIFILIIVLLMLYLSFHPNVKILSLFK